MRRDVNQKVLLTGRPGCGKTSLVKRVVKNDEIGPMEIRSATFRDAVNEVLESEVPLLATIWPRTGLFIRPREDRDRFSSGQWQPQIRAITEHNERQNYALERNHDD